MTLQDAQNKVIAVSAMFAENKAIHSLYSHTKFANGRLFRHFMASFSVQISLILNYLHLPNIIPINLHHVSH